MTRREFKNDRVLRAYRKEPVDATPVWIMRQAGRYLPQYRALRAKVDFLTLCKTPDLAAQATLMPIDTLGVDAAIIFSDILIPVQAMGMDVVFTDAHGPQLPKPIRDRGDVARLKTFDPETATGFVMEAIRQTNAALAGRVPLVGFAGAPYTLATYMVEGETSKNFYGIKRLIYEDPALLHALLDRLTAVVSNYLIAQVRAGAHAVQLFDTWAGLLSPEDYRTFGASYTSQVVEMVKPTGVPIILYVNGSGTLLEEMAETGVDVISVDWRVELADAKRRVGRRVALQGNLDPCALYAAPETIRTQVAQILAQYGSDSGHVFNLGHGILPDIPVAHAKAMVDAVHELSPAYHSPRA